MAFREAVEQAREAVDSAESMISAAERADSGALSQRPAQGVEASHVEDVESGEALSARQTDEAAQLSGQLDQVKRSVEDARRVIDGQELMRVVMWHKHGRATRPTRLRWMLRAT